MLFCFGLFALLLYYTVVANAECSYTYRHSSPQPIEARSWEYQKQGFTRCQYLIQLVNQHQQLKLNFTRLTGFGLYTHPSQQQHDPWGGEGATGEKEEEEGIRTGRWRGPKGNEGAEQGWLERDDDGRTGDQSQRSRFFTSSTTHSLEVEGGWSSRRSSVVSTQPTLGQQERSAKKYADTTTPWTKTISGGSPSSSVTTTVWPIPGSGGGHHKAPEGHAPEGHDGEDGDPPCLPMLEIRAVDREGREEMRHRICRQRHPTQQQHTPIVFHYASSVRIVYEWALGHSSGFTLFFHFSNTQPAERCVHTCDGATRCLSEARMLCDGRYDCRDRSDERTPVCLISTAPSTSRPLDGESLVQIIVIPSCAVAVVVVLSAVCLIGRRRWYEAHAGMHRSLGPSTQRPCHQSPRSEGSVARACSTHDCNEQVVALLPSSHRSHRSWRSSHPPSHPPAPPPPPQDPHIDLPPNIPVSPDGEEGYAASQLGLLHPRYHSTHSDMLFRPPPNKTVFDRESPPPYSVAPSPGTYGCSSAPCPSLMGLGQGVCWPGRSERVVRNSAGQAMVSRCYSMITPSDHPHPHIQGHPGPSAHNDCARPDPQRLPLLHGACRVTDTLNPSSPPHPSVEKCPPTPPATSSSSPAVLLSSSGGTIPCSPPPDSRTVLPGRSVCSTRVGQDHDSDSSSGDGGGESQAHHFAQLGASPCRQGALHRTGSGEDASWDVSHDGTTTTTPTATTTSNPAGV